MRDGTARAAGAPTGASNPAGGGAEAPDCRRGRREERAVGPTPARHRSIAHATAHAPLCRQGRKLQERRQTKQARADKAILVRALEALADELAHARADARRHAAAAESARSAAQRLGQAPESGVDTAEERGHRACGTARLSWPWAARQPSARVPPAAPIHPLLARRRGSHVSMCCVRAAAGPARAGAARRGRRRRRRRAQV